MGDQGVVGGEGSRLHQELVGFQGLHGVGSWGGVILIFSCGWVCLS